MIRWTVVALSMLMLWSLGSPARASTYSDDLAGCLMRSTTSDDRTTLAIWVFASMSAHPAVQPYSTTTDAQRDVANKAAGQLLQRLLFTDCRAETSAAVSHEGSPAIEAAFSVIGQAAMRTLITDPRVQQSLIGFRNYVDVKKFAQFGQGLMDTDKALKVPK